MATTTTSTNGQDEAKMSFKEIFQILGQELKKNPPNYSICYKLSDHARHALKHHSKDAQKDSITAELWAMIEHKSTTHEHLTAAKDALQNEMTSILPPRSMSRMVNDMHGMAEVREALTGQLMSYEKVITLFMMILGDDDAKDEARTMGLLDGIGRGDSFWQSSSAISARDCISGRRSPSP